jgi:hypothetical protein
MRDIGRFQGETRAAALRDHPAFAAFDRHVASTPLYLQPKLPFSA